MLPLHVDRRSLGLADGPPCLSVEAVLCDVVEPAGEIEDVDGPHRRTRGRRPEGSPDLRRSEGARPDHRAEDRTPRPGRPRRWPAPPASTAARPGCCRSSTSSRPPTDPARGRFGTSGGRAAARPRTRRGGWRPRPRTPRTGRPARPASGRRRSWCRRRPQLPIPGAEPDSSRCSRPVLSSFPAPSRFPLSSVSGHPGAARHLDGEYRERARRTCKFAIRTPLTP